MLYVWAKMYKRTKLYRVDFETVPYRYSIVLRVLILFCVKSDMLNVLQSSHQPSLSARLCLCRLAIADFSLQGDWGHASVFHLCRFPSHVCSWALQVQSQDITSGAAGK